MRVTLPTTVRTRQLSTADARRETVLAIADEVFAKRGFDATPTVAVAKAAGISHAYLFRLFETKSDLIVAVVRRCNERLRASLEQAVAAAPAGDLGGAATAALSSDRTLLVTHLHALVAAITDSAVREEMRAWFAGLHELSSAATWAAHDDIGRLLVAGPMLGMLGALDGFERPEPWVDDALAVLRGR